ncbi:unnamed protein product [Miscanthus lutarioriparius]|uniref:Uncharacterized protein n=1 Tax=Miscanthus lutarioriparius TaxID=422564 RepID=A0A811SHM9_9POAL|nr:unnamed protein product [Miscanthus lutarioriparius]
MKQKADTQLTSAKAERSGRQPLTPVQISATSPLTPEQDITGARKRPGELIPLRRHRLRLTDVTRNSKPPRNDTLTANPSSTAEKGW